MIRKCILLTLIFIPGNICTEPLTNQELLDQYQQSLTLSKLYCALSLAVASGTNMMISHFDQQPAWLQCLALTSGLIVPIITSVNLAAQSNIYWNLSDELQAKKSATSLHTAQKKEIFEEIMDKNHTL